MRKFLLTLSAIFCLLITSIAQNRTVTGKVTDESGNAVTGASVLVKGTRIGTTTNTSGNFSLSVPNNARTLVVSAISMGNQEVAIMGGTVNVALAARANSLEEVVINVPYGTIKKSAFTGSENTVTAAQIEKQRVTSVTRALEGMVPGLSATNGGGAPGTGAAIQIRGVGSVNASSSPLYVLNGAPYDGSIASISTSDIESITVLKDAAASALYGSRAANGVIMITTKTGKKGRAAVTANVYQGFQSRGIPEYDRVNPQQYYELFWEAYRNSYRIGQGQSAALAGQNASNVLTGSSGLVYNAYNVPGNQLVDPVTGKLNPNAQLLWNESWSDALFRTAPRTEANVSVSGASDKSNFYLSGGYLNEDGILRYSGYKRYNVRLNVNANATNWLNVGVNMDGAVSKRNDVPSGGTATTNPFYYSREMGPIYPVYQHNLTTGAFVDSLGQHQLDWGIPAQMGTRPYAGRSNLIGSLALDDRSRYIFNGNANTFAEIKFTKSLSLKNTLSVNYLSNNVTSYQNNQYGDAAPATNATTGQTVPGTGGRSTKTFDRQISITGNEILSYVKSFGDHNIRAIAGHENYKYQYNLLSANSQGFFFPGQSELDNGTSVTSNPSSNVNIQTIESYLGGINYDYKQKYQLSGSYRTDGSSKFREAVRWGNFYSAGAAWRIKRENFMEGVKWLNDLKLRGSYGEQGNQAIPDYLYQSYYYASGTGTYIPPSRPASPDISWEKNSILDLGLDFGLFNNRVQGTFDWYNKKSANLLFDVPLPTSTGYASVYQNIGTMQNTGVELQLSYSPIRSRNFNWNILTNLFHEKNEITKLPAVQETSGIISGTKKLLAGHSIYDFFLPEFAGVDASNGDALYYKDVLDATGKATGDRVITNVYNQATKYYVGGSALPKFRGGITNSFDYKGFNLSVFLTFSYGGKFYDANYASIMHRGSPGIAWSTDILNRWQKPGDVTTVPRLQNAISTQDGASSRWLVDASYLNIKNITLSYALAPRVAERLHLGGLSMHANVDNVWLFTAKKGSDIQRDFNGTADATYTPVRTFTVGFSVNLQ